MPDVEPKPLSMSEALAYWSSKTPLTREEISAVAEKAQARAFTVSGVARKDMLEAIHASLLQALAEGKSLQAWKKEAADVMSRAGITQRWRLDTIFRTNVQSAYMAGRYEQMRRTAKSRPYWRYVAVADSRTRPEHLALNGLVYPADHPFWDTYYPPNGFRCRCTVQTLSARDVQSRGYDVATDLPDLIEPIDPATGNRMPPVRPRPDPGFGTNVGRDWLAGLSPGPFDGDIHDVAADALCRGGQGLFADERCKPPLADLDQRHIRVYGSSDLLPRSMPKEQQVLAFLKEFGLADINASAVVRLPGNYPLVVGKGLFMDKAHGGFKGAWADKGPYLRLLARTIKDPFEVWWVPVEIGPQRRLVFSLRLIRLFRENGGQGIGGYCSFSLLGQEWHGATAFTPRSDRSNESMLAYLEKQRAGILIHREELK